MATPKAVTDLKHDIRLAAVAPHNSIQVVMNGIRSAIIIGGEGHGDDFRLIVPKGSTKGMTWAELMTKPYVRDAAPHGWVYFKWGRIECWIPATEDDTVDPEPCIRTITNPGSGGWHFHKCIRPRVPGSDLCAQHKAGEDRSNARREAKIAAEVGSKVARRLSAAIITELQTLARDGWNPEQAVTILTDLVGRAAQLESYTEGYDNV